MSRSIVVSGGASGIGRAIAALFAADGDEVLIVGRRERALADAAAEINARTGAERVTALAADLSLPAGADAVAAHVAGTGRGVDVLVNNAGGFFSLGDPRGETERYAASWRADFEGNVLTAVLLTFALTPHLARPGGRIISMSSIAALRGPGSYGGAKAALHAWTAELAGSLGPDGITANVIAPGFIADTEFFGDRMTPEGYASRVNTTLVKRAGTPEEVAELTRYLASPGAGYVTGQIVQINGGSMLGRG